MRYRTQSANVLNEADRFERILNFQLFVMEQETKLYGYNPDTDWSPGTPLYPNPRTHFRPGSEDEELEGYYGNCPRPIIQLLDDGDYYQGMKCQDCDVSWGRDETTCWMCGRDYPKSDYITLYSSASSSEPLFQIVGHTVDDRGISLQMELMRGLEEEMGARWRALMNRHMNFGVEMQRVQYAARDMAQTMRGFSAHFTVVDENPFHTVNVNLGPIEEYIPPYTGRIANPDRSPFELADVVGPLWGTAALYDPLGEPFGYARNRIRLPANWAELRADVPLPEMPEPRKFPSYEETYWERFNPPLQRRN